MKKLHSWKRSVDSELWRVKRLVWAKGLSEGDQQDEQDETADAEKEAAEAINAFRELDPAEAEHSITKNKELRDQQVDNVLDDWNGRASNLVKKLGAPFMDKVTNYQKLNDAVTNAAKEKVKQMVDGLNIEGDFLGEHADGSLSLLHAKSELLGELKGDLNETIKRNEDQLQAIADARKALGFWRKNRIGVPKDLKEKVDKLKQIRATAEQIQAKTENQIGKKEKVENNIEQFDGRLREIILRQNPTRAGALSNLIRDTILQNGNEKDFVKALKDNEFQLTDQELNICQSLMKLMINGKRGMRKHEVQDHFIKKQMERGIMNRDNDKASDRFNRLKGLPLGQEVFIPDVGMFYVVKKPSYRQKGFVLKKLGGEYAYLKTGKSGQPILTIQKGEKGKETFESHALKADQNKNDPSVTSVEFSTVGSKVKGSDQSKVEAEATSEGGTTTETAPRDEPTVEDSATREEAPTTSKEGSNAKTETYEIHTAPAVNSVLRKIAEEDAKEDAKKAEAARSDFDKLDDELKLEPENESTETEAEEVSKAEEATEEEPGEDAGEEVGEKVEESAGEEAEEETETKTGESKPHMIGKYDITTPEGKADLAEASKPKKEEPIKTKSSEFEAGRDAELLPDEPVSDKEESESELKELFEKDADNMDKDAEDLARVKAEDVTQKNENEEEAQPEAQADKPEGKSEESKEGTEEGVDEDEGEEDPAAEDEEQTEESDESVAAAA